MQKFTYIIKDELGLHARPAGLVVKAAAAYKSAIKLGKGGKEADLKRLFSVMGLAVKKGDTITVTVDGEDETAACAALKKFFTENV